MTNESNQDAGHKMDENNVTIIPVIQEYITIEKQVVDTAKVVIRKQTIEEVATINLPLIQEGYRVEHVPVNKVFDTPPTIRQEGDNTIIPVLREVLVVQKKYEVVEELHFIKEKTFIPYLQEITLKKEEVTIERTPLQRDDQL